MRYEADRRVDACIDALADWQQPICREVRDLVHSVDPEVVETIKFTSRPYFVLQGNICALPAAKDHVNVFLSTRPLAPSRSRRLAQARARAIGDSSRLWRVAVEDAPHAMWIGVIERLGGLQ